MYYFRNIFYKERIAEKHRVILPDTSRQSVKFVSFDYLLYTFPWPFTQILGVV
jgi:hypothetical protein